MHSKCPFSFLGFLLSTVGKYFTTNNAVRIFNRIDINASYPYCKNASLNDNLSVEAMTEIINLANKLK
jgi:hypothetical protein